LKILFDLNHPAHFHLFKNFIKHLKKEGHEVFVASREKDITNVLLDKNNIKYVSISKAGKSLLGFAWELIRRDIKLFTFHSKFRFDYAFGTSVPISHLSAFTKVKSFNFHEDDDKIDKMHVFLGYPFSTKIVNPDCLKYKRFRKKRVLVPSYHELAYLHPDNFEPDIKVLSKYGLEKENYIIARFSALHAHNDIGNKGIDKNLWNSIENLLNGYTIIKSIENDITHFLDPHDMHHILAFSKMVISDSQTMIAEAAVLGIPSVRYNGYVGKISYMEELEYKYDLTYGFKPGQESGFYDKIKNLLEQTSLKQDWQEKKIKMLEEKVDFNAWMVDYFSELII
jgi:uncharacterized protein